MTKTEARQVSLLLIGFGIVFVAFLSYLTGASAKFAWGYLAIPGIIAVLFSPLIPFLAFVASFPFNVIPLAEGLDLSIPRMIGFFLFIAWSVYIFRGNRARLLRIDRVSLSYLTFVGWGFLTYFWSPEKGRTLLIGSTLLQLWVFYFIGMSIIDSTKKLKPVVIATIVSCSFVAVNSIIRSIGRLRAVGVEGSDENEFAALMIFPIFLSLNMALYHKNIWLKILFGLLIVVLMLGAAATVSRGFLIAILIGFIYRIFLDVDKKKALAAILFILILTGPYVYVRYAKRFQKEPPIYVKELPQGRHAIWIVGREIILAHPVIGIGMGAFPWGYDTEYQQHRDITGYVGYRRTGHNDFITIAAEYGIIGLLIWLILVRYILRESYRMNGFFLQQGDSYMTAIANATACSLLSLLLCQAFLGLYMAKFFWLPIVMIPILKNIARSDYGFKDNIIPSGNQS